MKITRLLIMLALIARMNQVSAQGTAFAYQGRLYTGSIVANGNYDLVFTLYGTNITGTAIAGPLTNTAVAMLDGLFTTLVDFGTGIFTGTNCWLDISVRTNGSGTFSDLSPRQPITPTPYSITAANLSGVVENNLIGAGVSLATIGGGSGNLISVGADYSTIGGGQGNFALGFAATISGGNYSTAYGTNSTVSGGYYNVADGLDATVSGGDHNYAIGPRATVGGGEDNTAGGADSFAAGYEAHALNDGTFVWADSQEDAFSSTANNQFLIRASGGVGINMNNPDGASLYVQGNRNGGFGQSIGFFENSSTATGNSPALRVVCDGGSTPSGALSVSANGTGNIAEFGNNTSFVVTIANSGTLTCQSLVQTSDRNAKENFVALECV